MRPTKHPREKGKNAGISLPLPVIAAAKKRAFAEGKSFSKWVREILVRELEAQQ